MVRGPKGCSVTATVPAVDLDAVVYGDDLRCQGHLPPWGERCPEPAAWLCLLPCGCSVLYGHRCQPIVAAWLAALVEAGIPEMTCVQCRTLDDLTAVIWEPI